MLAKPDWIRVRLSHGPRFHEVKRVLREQRLHTVCEEASCPNIGECFGSGTATFMILGDLCTRRCPFCDVAHGRPEPPDADEPAHLAHTVALLALNHVVITSVDRDDLRDGGAAHFAACIDAVRQRSPNTRIEVLVPDFRGRLAVALEILAAAPPDVLNHNLETVPRLYREARPGADYAHSLQLLRAFKARRPECLTKSGLMLGLGETDDEVVDVMRDLRRQRRRHAHRRPVSAAARGQSAGAPLRAAGRVRSARSHRPPNGVRARGLRSAGPFQLSRRPPGAGGRRLVTRSSTPEIRSIE